MKKITRRFLAVIIAGVMGLTVGIPAFAEETADENNDALKVYMDELSRINEELGTDYSIPVEYFDESELEEAKQFFLNMSLDEFRDYIYTIHYNYISGKSGNNNISSEQEQSESETVPAASSFSEGKLIPTEVISVDGETALASETTDESVCYAVSSNTLVTQRCYYDVSNTDNYLYLQAENFTMNGYPRYNTYDNFAGGYFISSYPGYRATSCSISFSNYDRVAACIFTCMRMLSKYVNDGEEKSLSCTFVAGGGDLYAV